MFSYYTGRDLSCRLGINHARWKRWARQFLPPDPLGGLQSGYARQYNPDEAFTVYLGGHLVSELKLSIPEARKILQDLDQWLTDHHYYFDFVGRRRESTPADAQVKEHRILIFRRRGHGKGEIILYYKIQALRSVEKSAVEEVCQVQEQYDEILPPDRSVAPDIDDPFSYRVLRLSRLREHFLKNLNI